MKCHILKSIHILLCLPLLVAAAEEAKRVESDVTATDLIPRWTAPDAWFPHGNPAPGWPDSSRELAARSSL